MSAHRIVSAASRLRWAPVSLVAGVVATGALALSMNGTLAAFTASITHNGNSINTGTLTMQEVGPGGTPVTCNSTDGTTINTNTATCTGINHYGGANSVPGAVQATTVTIRNSGTVAANGFTVKFDACSQGANTAAGNTAGSATDLCTKTTLGVTATPQGGSASTVITAGTSLTAANTGGTSGVYSLSAVPAGQTVSFTFTTTLPSTLANTYQGLSATQPITFQFTS